MNKKILSAVLALVMLVSMMSVMAFADEGEHTHDFRYTSLQSTCVTYCASCDFAEYGEHSFVNGVCKCGLKEDDCRHDKNLEVGEDKGNVHEVFCAECGAFVYNAVHSYEENKVCACGHVDTCAHEEKTITSYGPKEGHYFNCKECIAYLGSEAHKFDKETKTCTVCGEKMDDSCKHEHKVWIINTAERTHCLTCVDCREEFSEHEPHEFVNGICEKCGEDECAHEGAKCVEAPFEDGHFMYCDDCGQTLIPLEPHFFKNGVCQRCGAKKVTHVHYISGMNGQICLLCGAEIHCSHKAGDLVEWGSESHGRKCVNCGSIIEEDHTFVNGTCTVCGTKPKGECKHENQQWVYNEMDGTHVLLCVDCFELMSEPEQHEFKDGVCVKCGAEKSEPTNPSEEPTNPSEEPTNPSEEPTNPSEEPTNPSEEPTNPSEEPTNPSEETTKPDAVNGVPQTGDTNNMAQWMGIVVLGCAGMAAAYVCGKKRI